MPVGGDRDRGTGGGAEAHARFKQYDYRAVRSVGYKQSDGSVSTALGCMAATILLVSVDAWVWMRPKIFKLYRLASGVQGHVSQGTTSYCFLCLKRQLGCVESFCLQMSGTACMKLARLHFCNAL